MVKHNDTAGQGRVVGSVLLGLAGLAVLFAVLMYGKDIVLFNPKGIIADGQTRLIITVVAIFLSVAVPTLALLYFFAWKYRESNTTAKRAPSKRKNRFSAFSLWIVPCLVLLILASVMIPATHKLDPHKAIVTDTQPLTIQVIALRSKWLFIYPEQNIATVNFVQIPVNTPVQFELTADEAPMNSFWIPHLGGQLYAMTSHSNQLNLMADTPGDYAGQAAEINGPGFADMKFMARASSQADFDAWLQNIKQSADPLSQAEYQKLLIPSENNPIMVYSTAPAKLYDTVLLKYGGSHGHHEGTE
ncbi:MAG: COX aromatic rich motif-containing protein [Candidatus Saccharimonadales bacterium]